uniref:Uncharacterized protein n=1 Tax=Anguilla anguilla TaxID=7936 RepID=A0A0E9PNS1_ANGAN
MQMTFYCFWQTLSNQYQLFSLLVMSLAPSQGIKLNGAKQR